MNNDILREALTAVAGHPMLPSDVIDTCRIALKLTDPAAIQPAGEAVKKAGGEVDIKYMRATAKALRDEDNMTRAGYWALGHDAADFLDTMADYFATPQDKPAPIQDAKAEHETGCVAVNPPEFPKYMADFCEHMSKDDVWQYGCLTGWRCATPATQEANSEASELPKPERIEMPNDYWMTRVGPLDRWALYCKDAGYIRMLSRFEAEFVDAALDAGQPVAAPSDIRVSGNTGDGVLIIPSAAPVAPAQAVTDERRGGSLYRAVIRACGELPDGCEIRIELERGCGMVAWYDEDGNRTVIDGEGYLCADVEEALAAILAKRTESGT